MPRSALAPAAGVGFKLQHFAAITAAPPAIGFFEVHAENDLGAGGPPLAQLERVRRDYQLSIHGVGLSIGGTERPDAAHRARLRQLSDRFQPESFSEHIAWSGHGDFYLNDLLPVPLTPETFRRVAAHVDEVQERLGRRMLIENPSTYLAFAESTILEPAFLAELCRRTGCGLARSWSALIAFSKAIRSARSGWPRPPARPLSPSPRCACRGR